MVSTTAISASQEQQYTAADVDQDGYLTEEEFNSAFPDDDFSAYDADGDGKVSKDEYRETTLENNKGIADMMWKMAMKMFKLDQFKPADVGIEKPDYL